MSQSANQLSSEVKDGFSTVTAQISVSEAANEARHQTVLVHLDDAAERDTRSAEKLQRVFQQQVKSMDINEEAFEAVHSRLLTTASSNLEEHRTTHAMLTQCQGQLQRLLRNHLTFGMANRSVDSPSSCSTASSISMTMMPVFWSYSYHRLPIGTLQISLNQIRKTKTQNATNSKSTPNPKSPLSLCRRCGFHDSPSITV